MEKYPREENETNLDSPRILVMQLKTTHKDLPGHMLACGFKCIQEIDYKSLFDLVPGRVSLFDISLLEEGKKRFFRTQSSSGSRAEHQRWIGVASIEKLNQNKADHAFKLILV